MLRKKLTRASVKLLPSETLCSIFRFALEDIIEDDMKTTAEAEHRVIAGGLPFPHTMASVCRQWRDVISSAPELWTRIFCVMPNKSRRQTLTDLTSQLQKAHGYPVHLTIVNKHNHLKQKEVPRILNFIALHIGQLKSLRIRNFYGLYIKEYCDTLAGHAPQLECLQVTGPKILGCWTTREHLPPLFKLDCPTLRILHIDHKVAHSLDHQWLKNNLTNVESVTLSFGDELPCYGPSYSVPDDVPKALNAVPGRIPCLIIDGLQFPFQTISRIKREGLQIGAEKVVVRGCMKVLAIVDDHCKTIVIRDCEVVEDPRIRRFPSSDTLEFDECFGSSLEMAPLTPSWNGDTVTITNSNSLCMKAIFVLLGAPFKDSSCSLWPRVTTLKLVANGDFILRFPFKMLKAMISSRREAAGQENLGKNDVELDAIGFKGVRPIMVLHVHGGHGLLRKEREWFEEQVRDFVWDCKKR
ncbi:uncharacterized protein HD556DRAFT_1342037 [Suillus plorans]|uniref:F-box domain-containing protein n=1 Tax=Suillus plorans TaxID=116603 RepID=A0A9P7J319_9AGAM|nr:uncharacterized protein HD556DRAFT_1342037 [Suillus plorans]KAG1800272.1 hypothetical protein HD556DRAFT_1342037 [Suillus plorans]